MQDDPDEFRNPLMERRRWRRRRSVGSIYLFSVAILAAIVGLWGGLNVGNKSDLKPVIPTSATGPDSKNEAALADPPAAKRPAEPSSPVQIATEAITLHRQASEATATAEDSATASPFQKVASIEVAAPSDETPPAAASTPVSAPESALAPTPGPVVAAVPIAGPALVGPPAPAPAQPIERPRPEPAAPAKPVPPPSALSADEQQEMLQRVAPLLQQGDIAAARLILERLDRMGNGRASYDLAETYDPVALAKWNVMGIQADANKALQYYERALEEGVSEARAHVPATVTSSDKRLLINLNR